MVSWGAAARHGDSSSQHLSGRWTRSEDYRARRRRLRATLQLWGSTSTRSAPPTHSSHN